MQLNRIRGFHPRAPGVYPLEDTGEVEKQRISSAALHRISYSRVGPLSSVALFSCIFSFGTFFGIIRIYTVVFSDPEIHHDLVCIGCLDFLSQISCHIPHLLIYQQLLDISFV